MKYLHYLRNKKKKRERRKCLPKINFKSVITSFLIRNNFGQKSIKKGSDENW